MVDFGNALIAIAWEGGRKLLPIKSNRSVKEVTAAIVTFLYILLFVIFALISPIPVSIRK